MRDLELSFIAAVRDARDDDDGPRRAYADWLLERGDPRGAYMALALAPGAPEPESPAWEETVLPVAIDAAAAWEARFGPGFRLDADDFARGLPSDAQFDGKLPEVAARAAALAPWTAQDLWIGTDDDVALVRADWRVLAHIRWREFPEFAFAGQDTARVRVLALPSLDVIAERAHPYRGFPTRSGEPTGLRFARHADELCYRVDDNAQVLLFALPPTATRP